MHPEPSNDAVFRHTLKEHLIVAMVDVHADQHGPSISKACLTTGAISSGVPAPCRMPAVQLF